jgi:hypothetical protein
MADEGKLLEAQSRALRARQLLDDELIQEAFDGLEAAYTAAWRSSKVDEADAREKLFMAVNLVGKVRDHLISIVSNGKLAAVELREIADTAERTKRRG